MAFRFCRCLLLGPPFSSFVEDEVVLDDMSLRGMLTTGTFVVFFPNRVCKNFFTGPAAGVDGPVCGSTGVFSFSGLRTGSFETGKEDCFEGNTAPFSKVSVEDVELWAAFTLSDFGGV